MELWVRSQDKEALIKVDKIFYRSDEIFHGFKFAGLT